MTQRDIYEQYLQSDHWRALRQAAIWVHGNRCELCGTRPRYPHVHHINYRNLTDVTVSDLLVLCKPCYRRMHTYLEKLHRMLKGNITREAAMNFWRHEKDLELAQRRHYLTQKHTPKKKLHKKHGSRHKNFSMRTGPACTEPDKDGWITP